MIALPLMMLRLRIQLQFRVHDVFAAVAVVPRRAVAAVWLVGMKMVAIVGGGGGGGRSDLKETEKNSY